jgi:hypothetical protein
MRWNGTSPERSTIYEIAIGCSSHDLWSNGKGNARLQREPCTCVVLEFQAERIKFVIFDQPHLFDGFPTKRGTFDSLVPIHSLISLSVRRAATHAHCKAGDSSFDSPESLHRGTQGASDFRGLPPLVALIHP